MTRFPILFRPSRSPGGRALRPAPDRGLPRARRPVLAGLAVALGLFGSGAWAQAAPGKVDGFPNKPITLVVPSTAGNVNDAVARILGQELQAAWGQPVIVENRPGAGAVTGTKVVLGAPKDGHTLLLTFTAHVQNPSLIKNTGYDPVKDFAAVSEVALSSVMLVAHPQFEAKTVADIVKLAKAKPGELAYGSYGTGTTGHILGEQFKRAAGLDLMHVAYKGGAPLVNDLAAGHVKFGWAPVGTAIALVKAGKLRPVAFAGEKRSALLPEVPTLAEAGYKGFEPDAWMGLLAPAGVPAERINALSAQIQRIVHKPEVAQRMRELNLVPVGSTAPAFQAKLASDLAHWTGLIRELNITAE
ncbi:ABC transporter substrate-binding protein [Comamonas serinivorans]|uniref:ABC transporter substrate-binding protein n=1 Tax=Comamonas serinivorans TaxID=1082851 RepID=A0A1Y0EKM7_9BURK|nr:tripartite tricarboxylate transporter substrate binding protein [Comamonas serinivorans]ARU04194.1 ABC transporter substrate-binding protein [Comamonas serinivorans]